MSFHLAQFWDNMLLATNLARESDISFLREMCDVDHIESVCITHSRRRVVVKPNVIHSTCGVFAL